MVINIHSTKRIGSGILNKAIDSLPFELHFPSYQFCGPGTKLKKRLERGDQGINQLDRYCKDHDIAYEKSSKTEDRREADKVLADQAKNRIFAKDSSLLEKLGSIGVYGAMNIKRYLGAGHRRRRRKRKTKKPLLAAVRNIAGGGLFLKPFNVKKKIGKGLKRKRRRRRKRV